ASLRHLTIETPIHNTQAVFIASNIQHLHYLNLCLSPKEFTQIEAKNFGDGIASGSLNELCLTLPATDKREEIIVTGERSRSVIRSCPSFTIDELAEALARHKNTSLQKLVLHQGYFQNKQATSLAQIIRHTVIQELQLGTNEDETDHESDQFIGNRGLSDLMDALAQNDTLTSFSFCCDKATESGFKLIAEAVEKNTTIKSLAVGTYLTIKREATFIAFAIAFLKNETLTSFNLDNCVENYPIPIHLADMIESQLELNKKIEGISSPTDSITYYNQLLQFRNEKQKVFDDYINSHAKSFLRHNYLSSERLRLLGNTQQLGAPANEIETTDALDKSPVFET
ncbi:MAG TPA: hypothetical protein VHZ76_05485, partial [Gammaproteobacteria bacterium]|nr:hypothetical protein [Gammaproteobacteria bacterium]